MNMQDERGFALPMAIFGMLIAAVIITGATFLGRQELRVAIANSNGILALYLAERGLANTMVDWDPVVLSTLPLVGDTTPTDTLDTGSV